MSNDQRRSDIQRALRACLFAVDNFVIGEASNLAHVPNAARTRLIVEAALAYLVGNRLIAVVPDEEWPDLLPVRVPPELKPDAAGEAQRIRRAP